MLDEGARSALATTRFADVRWFGEIDSTNRYLLEEARLGAPAGLVAVADHQTAGRGRLGRTWVAPPAASLLVSVLLRPDLPPDHLHLASVAVALSMADACAQQARFEPEIKWPNDLMVGERKLAGVLAETDLGRPAGAGPDPGGAALPAAVVVGVGINVNWPAELPEDLAGRAVALNHITGRPVDRSRLLVAMLAALEPRADQLDSEAGRARLSSEYRARCATVGREVRVDLQDESFTGVASDVDDHGHLLVQTGVCLREVTAGDVVHLRPT
ncbi:MAG TPA: biotin--[acetyl-CoA-carboxylase] ligase [Acidimicrobiales bacterium]|nr:biotin--[acetyl-CoA-carboxylase] ligase [Acidimicrobiales bacterium]